MPVVALLITHSRDTTTQRSHPVDTLDRFHTEKAQRKAAPTVSGRNTSAGPVAVTTDSSNSAPLRVSRTSGRIDRSRLSESRVIFTAVHSSQSHLSTSGAADSPNTAPNGSVTSPRFGFSAASGPDELLPVRGAVARTKSTMHRQHRHAGRWRTLVDRRRRCSRSYSG